MDRPPERGMTSLQGTNMLSPKCPLFGAPTVVPPPRCEPSTYKQIRQPLTCSTLTPLEQLSTRRQPTPLTRLHGHCSTYTYVNRVGHNMYPAMDEPCSTDSKSCIGAVDFSAHTCYHILYQSRGFNMPYVGHWRRLPLCPT